MQANKVSAVAAAVIASAVAAFTTVARAEHYTDYAYSPKNGLAPFRNSTLFSSGPALPFIHDRMPFPNCLDLSGFCQ